MNRRQEKYHRRIGAKLSQLHSDVFEAMRASPKPYTQESALAAGLAAIADGDTVKFPNAAHEFKGWFETNGARWVFMMNSGVQ